MLEQVKAAGGTGALIAADVGEAGDIKRLFAEADKLGRLGGLINNAGIVDRQGARR